MAFCKSKLIATTPWRGCQFGIVFALLSFNPAPPGSAAEATVIPVPRIVIYAGQKILDRHLKGRKVPLKYLDRVSVVTNRIEIVGKVARATLMPNQPISTNYVREPDVVIINKPAIMEYSSGLLRITAEVIPLNSAKAGEFVRARNIQSGAIITGTAKENGAIAAGTGPGAGQ